MRRIIGFAILLISCNNLFSQKKPLDFFVQETWPMLSPKQISNDGKFISYTISAIKSGTILMVQATEGGWKRELPGLDGGRFTEDSKRFIFRRSDTIGVLDLNNNRIQYITNAGNFETPKDGNGQWLAYMAKQPGEELILVDLFAGKSSHYTGINNFKFSDDGKFLVMEKINLADSVSSIVWMDLKNAKTNIIAHGCQSMKMVFDHQSHQFIFLAKEESNRKPFITLRYFKQGMDSAIIMVDRFTEGMEEMMISTSMFISFSPDDTRVFFFLEKKSNIRSMPENKKRVATIQGYLDDDYFNSTIIGDAGPYLASLSVNGRRIVVRLQREGDGQVLSSDFCRGNYVLLKNSRVETKGVDSGKVSLKYYDVYLVSCQDGFRTAINNLPFIGSRSVEFSPGGKYLYWFDGVKSNWFTYNIFTGKTKNVTKGTGVAMSVEKDYPDERPAVQCPFIGWLENDKELLVQDRYDVWQVDPEGIEKAVNITNGYGQKHRIQLQYVNLKRDRTNLIHTGDTLYFSALDLSNKKNGFCYVIVGRNDNSVKLVLEQRMYYHNFSSAASSGLFNLFLPVKAKFANVYAAMRMSDTEYPNIYVSKNLKDFEPITNLEPQKEYNWFTTELLQWKLPDGKETSGVLYKPQDFDPHKKYPVIVFIYEKHSSSLNCFIHPALSYGAISIPWYVSNGYLVFIPDIYYKLGYPGQSAYNAVISGVAYLTKMPYVDSHHIGLQGHSFGGFETNYIISRTHRFAAAASSAGLSDLISLYTSSIGSQRYFEDGQGRMGARMLRWEEMYIENSAVFRTDQVSTPILIMHNPRDWVVPIGQGNEWYNGLVRSGKKAWMLSYDGEEHVLKDESNKLDYTIKQTQFFDHYLKGVPAPEWMTAKPDYSILKSPGK